MPGTGGFAGGPLTGGRETPLDEPVHLLGGALPTRFESYEILRKEDGSLWELGRGAMGITYKAIDVDLQVPVALKVINPTVLGNTDAADRFLREARSAAKLRHGNIASVFRLGRAGNTHFYAMEFCEGQTVHQLVDRRGPLELKLALEITLQVTQALIVAQDHGVVHRDIKPSNLMVTGRVPDEFTVKVIDFGLAKHTAQDAADIDISVASNRAGFVGTAHFASPEQLEDRPVDFRSDIYSLGVTLWYMLTGRPLFEGSLTRVVTQHLAQKPPLEKLPWLPSRIAGLMDSMLAKEIDSRPVSMRALRDALQLSIEEASSEMTFAAHSSTSPAAHPSSIPRPVPPPSRGSSPGVPGSTPAGYSAVPPVPSSHGAPPSPSTPPLPPPIPSAYGAPVGSAVPPAPPASTPPSFHLPPPPMPPPPSAWAPTAEQQPTRPKPNSAGPAILVAVLAALIVIGGLGAGFAFKRWGKKLIPGQTQTSSSGDSTTNAGSPTPGPNTTPIPEQLNKPDTLRQLRLAQEAAEKLSKDLQRAEVNDNLIAMVQARPNPDAEALQGYRTTGDVIERNIIDDEQQYLISAKRLAKAPPEVLREAFDELDREVATAGIGWRVRVTELLRSRIANVKPEATRVDSQFRDELKGLQNN